MTVDELNALLPLFRAACFLCGGRQAFTGIWFPKRQDLVEAPAGKTRAFIYTLCRKCKRKPSTADRIEHVVLAQFAARQRVN